MKKILFLLMAVACMMTGCSKGGDDELDNGKQTVERKYPVSDIRLYDDNIRDKLWGKWRIDAWDEIENHQEVLNHDTEAELGFKRFVEFKLDGTCRWLGEDCTWVVADQKVCIRRQDGSLVYNYEVMIGDSGLGFNIMYLHTSGWRVTWYSMTPI